MISDAISPLLQFSSDRKWSKCSSTTHVTQSHHSSSHMQGGWQRLEVYAGKSANCGLRCTPTPMTEAITKKCSKNQSGFGRAGYSNSTWLIHTKSRRRQVLVCDSEQSCFVARSLYLAEEQLEEMEHGYSFPYSTGFRIARTD